MHHLVLLFYIFLKFLLHLFLMFFVVLYISLELIFQFRFLVFFHFVEYIQDLGFLLFLLCLLFWIFLDFTSTIICSFISIFIPFFKVIFSVTSYHKSLEKSRLYSNKSPAIKLITMEFIYYLKLVQIFIWIDIYHRFHMLLFHQGFSALTIFLPFQ